MTATLSIFDARKLVLLSQWLPWVKPAGRAPDATLAAVRHLGYVQIDTISVIERAHHHTLWNRNRRYQPAHLEQLLRRKTIFEYWSHAAAYLPMEDYRFCLPRMRAIAGGERHWYAPDRAMMKKVLERIAAEGPLRAQDFQSAPRAKSAKAVKAGMWDSRPAKRALEQLFMEGKLMIPRRQGFNKLYDLAERVLPSATDTTAPTQTEYARFLITRFLRANGIGRPAEIAYLRTGVKAIVERCAAQMAKRGELVPLQVKDRLYYALPTTLALLDRPLSRKRLKILSPFDNLLIQRERMRHLFDFDYQIECYLPANKRKHGYFCLPLLWDGKLVAKMDCKADRQTQTLIIRNLITEPLLAKKTPQTSAAEALTQELNHFATFNRCEKIKIGTLRDKGMQGLLKEVFG